jgi:hypothetical protein
MKTVEYRVVDIFYQSSPSLFLPFGNSVYFKVFYNHEEKKNGV